MQQFNVLKFAQEWPLIKPLEPATIRHLSIQDLELLRWWLAERAAKIQSQITLLTEKHEEPLLSAVKNLQFRYEHIERTTGQILFRWSLGHNCQPDPSQAIFVPGEWWIQFEQQLLDLQAKRREDVENWPEARQSYLVEQMIYRV